MLNKLMVLLFCVGCGIVTEEEVEQEDKTETIIERVTCTVESRESTKVLICTDDTETVIETSTDPIFAGSYCSRLVIVIGNKYYLVHSNQLILLRDDEVIPVGKKCSVLYDSKLEYVRQERK